MERKMKHVHPGETLKMELVEGRKLSLENIAELLDTPISNISTILNGEASITPAIALKLETVFGGSADFFLRLQNTYDLGIAKKSS